MSADDDQLWELFVRIRPQIRAQPGFDAELARHGVVRPAGLKDLAAGERWDYAVCLPLDRRHPLRYRDNRRGRCAHCRGAIQFRPDLPKGPVKLCVSCALRQVRGDA
jgi:hypothetical protein